MKLHEYFSGLLVGVVNINRDRLDQLASHERAITDFCALIRRSAHC
jgi:hypothetical protein